MALSPWATPTRELQHASQEISNELISFQYDPGEFIDSHFRILERELRAHGAIGFLRRRTRTDAGRDTTILQVDEMPYGDPTTPAPTLYNVTAYIPWSGINAAAAQATAPTWINTWGQPPGQSTEHSSERALELLFHNLNDTQRQQYIDKKYFEVIGKRSKATYRIYRANSSNVAQMHKDGKEKARYCLAIADGAPVYDLMLAEKLLLETDEKKFLKTANKSAGRNN